MRRLIVVFLGLVLVSTGCGGGDETTVTTTAEAVESASESNLVPVEVLTAPVVKQCLSNGGAVVTSVESLLPEGSIVDAKGVFALGPSGGRIGIIITRKSVVTNRVARELAGEGRYDVQKTRDGRAIIVLDSKAADEDEALAAGCVEA
jgi:hypothetical protein